MLRERDYTVDIVKFLAVFLIINSHADIMYPRLSILATGGAIGDCLFLFVSGFTLFLGEQKTFGNYYKRRISRIYPSVFVCLILSHFLSGNMEIGLNELLGRNFIKAIMIYYVFLYYIRKYAINYIHIILLLVFILSLAVYLIWFPYKYEISSKGIYGVTTSFRWIPYFGAMLLGAVVGMRRTELHYCFKKDILKLLFCLLLFYSIQYTAKYNPSIASWQIITIVPLLGIIFFFYKSCHNSFFESIYKKPICNKIILFVAGVCLESYLMQNSFFTDKLNNIWPFNLLLIIIIILLASYIARCLARVLLQTFEKGEYNCKKIFEV